jgi:hypothetical protein
MKPASFILLAVLLLSGCRSDGPHSSPTPVQSKTDGDAEWRLAMVTSDSAWHMSEARGVLKRDGDQLSGVLIDPKDKDAKVDITITLKDNSATARFKLSPEVDEQFVTASGTDRKWNPAGANGCVEQINLINDHEYIGLFRDYACKP